MCIRDSLWYERNYSEKTVLAYSEDIKKLQEFAQEEYGRCNPLEVEAELIREWIVSLMDRGYTSTSVNRKLSSLRSFYKYLLRQGEVTKDPLCKITGPDVYKRQLRNPALKNNSLLLVFVRTYILLISCSSKSFNSLVVM